MTKHFHISITDEAFSFAQNPLSIAAEALGGSLELGEDPEHLEHGTTGRRSYRGLAAFVASFQGS